MHAVCDHAYAVEGHIGLSVFGVVTWASIKLMHWCWPIIYGYQALVSSISMHAISPHAPYISLAILVMERLYSSIWYSFVADNLVK
jgi:hypothetical protein